MVGAYVEGYGIIKTLHVELGGWVGGRESLFFTCYELGTNGRHVEKNKRDHDHSTLTKIKKKADDARIYKQRK